MPDIRMPDGQVVRFPDTMTDVQIRGLIAHKFPREVGEFGASKPMDQRNTAGHGEFDESAVPDNQHAQPYMDTSRSFASGIRQGAEGAIGLPGTIRDLAQSGLSGGMEWLTGSPEAGDIAGKAARYLTPFALAPSVEDIADRTNAAIGEPYEPQTTAGEYARTAGEFAGGALAPGGPVRKLAQAAVPAVLSEGAGQVTKGSAWEPAARLVGGLVGAGAPGLPALARAVKQSFNPQAATAIIKDMQRAGKTPDEIKAALANLGDEAAPIDLPEFQQRGQRIYAKGGEGRQTIGQFLRPRDEASGQRVRDTLDQNLGPAPVPSRVADEINVGKKAVGPEYEAAFADARAVDTQGIVDDLMSKRANVRGAAKAAIDDVVGQLRIDGTEHIDPHPRALHAVRRSIDGKLSETTNTDVRSVLKEARKRIDDELASKAPGIKDADAKYAELSRQQEGFDRGVTVLDSGRSTPRPVELADELSAASPAVREKYAQGARAEIDRLVGTNANDRIALQRAVKGEGDWNREKLNMLFGKDKVDPVLKRVDAEKAFQATNNRVMHGSATAERLPWDEATPAFGVREAAMAGGPKGVAWASAIRLAEKALEKVAGTTIARRDADIARMLTDTDRHQIMTQLMKANGNKLVSRQALNSFLLSVVPPSVPISQSGNAPR